MVSYFSPLVLCGLLPLTALAYQAAPRRMRGPVLLVSSYAFLWYLSGRLVVFVVASAASIWLTGLALGRELAARDAELARGDLPRGEVRRACRSRMRRRLAAGVALNLGMLVLLRYLPALGSALGEGVALPALPAIGAPVGISFYTLQAVSYLVDVYRGTCPPDRNPARLALFLAFFPQVMEGPICRYGQVAQRLWAGEPIRADALSAGLVRVLWGLAKTVVVANRLNAFVKPVFDDPGAYDGTVIALAAGLYALQLYCDFSGAMDFAVGVGAVFGARPPENFRQPFFSRTASEFWMRWHITLGAWFRDYVFYPVSLSAPVKRLGSVARRAAGPHLGPVLASAPALLCVWLGNGLWHGAGSQYLLFGAYYFLVIWLGGLVGALAAPLLERVGIDRDALPYRAFQHVRTLLVIVAGELVFRASGAAEGIFMLSRVVTGFRPESLVDGTVLAVGMDAHDFGAVGAFALALLVVGVCRERGISPLGRLCERGEAPRWALGAALVAVTLVFGAYGAGYVPVDPMYAQF